jgi:hypothetical protein
MKRWIRLTLMMFIPFSPLQAACFIAGLAEIDLTLRGLGLMRRDTLAAS